MESLRTELDSYYPIIDLIYGIANRLLMTANYSNYSESIVRRFNSRYKTNKESGLRVCTRERAAGEFKSIAERSGEPREIGRTARVSSARGVN